VRYYGLVKRSLLIILVAGLCAVFGALLLIKEVRAPESQPKSIKVTFGGRDFNALVADTEKEREHGLSGTPQLAPDEAMLFVLDGPTRACFWMKDMRYNLDILWFDSDKHLTHDVVNVSPSSYPNTYCPPRDAKYVLEIVGGTLRQLNVGPNAPVYFNY
jgi:uncharacterized membrane protein (UPF0127 family)